MQIGKTEHLGYDRGILQLLDIDLDDSLPVNPTSALHFARPDPKLNRGLLMVKKEGDRRYFEEYTNVLNRAACYAKLELIDPEQAALTFHLKNGVIACCLFLVLMSFVAGTVQQNPTDVQLFQVVGTSVSLGVLMLFFVMAFAARKRVRKKLESLIAQNSVMPV